MHERNTARTRGRGFMLLVVALVACGDARSDDFTASLGAGPGVGDGVAEDVGGSEDDTSSEFYSDEATQICAAPM